MESEPLPPVEVPTRAISRFSGPRAFEQQIGEALACAAQEGWREMLWCDANFQDWPLNTLMVQEALLQWALPGRRLTLLAVRYDEMERRQPRFVTWRRRFDHLVDARVARAAVDDFPSAILGPKWFLQRIDRLRSVSFCGDDPERLFALREDLGHRLKESVPGFPASTLGL